MRSVDITQVDRSTLADICNIHIDPAMPTAEKMQSYLEQIVNPYCFLCGDTPVKIRFVSESKTLKQSLCDYFLSLKWSANFPVAIFDKILVIMGRKWYNRPVIIGGKEVSCPARAKTERHAPAQSRFGKSGFIFASPKMMTVQIGIQVKVFSRHQRMVSFFAIESLQQTCSRWWWSFPCQCDYVPSPAFRRS